MPTRRSHGEGTIRKRPDGRWEARLTLPNGSRKSFYSKTRKAVQDKLGAAQRDLDQGLSFNTDRLTVSEYLETWLLDVKDSLRHSTWKSYESYIRNHIKPALGHIRLRELNAVHVNKMMTGMQQKGLSPRTMNYVRAVLRCALNDAIDADLTATNAAAKARAAKQQQHHIEPLSPEEVIAFRKHTREHWLGPLLHVATATGLRQGELLALRWEDIDLETATLTVRNTLSQVDGAFTLTPPKTDKSRRKLALDPTTVDAVQRQRAQQELAREAAGDSWVEWGLVFSTTKGTPQDGSNVTHRTQRLFDEAGLPKKTFHNLRHSAASLLYANGADIKMIQDVLGHSQISLTANTYTHLGDAMRREAAAKMGHALSALSD